MNKINLSFQPLLLVLLAGFVFSCNSENNSKQEGYKINAHITGLQDGQAVLMKLDLDTNEPLNVDSVSITDGKFNFTGQLSDPYLHTILISNNPPQKIHLFLENCELTITGRADALEMAKISGSREDSVFKSYTQDEIFEKGPGVDIMMNHPDYNFAAFVAYYQFQLFNYSLDTMTMIMEGFSETVKESEYYKHLVPLYNNLKRVSIGQPAPEFKVPNQIGDTITLTNFRGQYVLLDFWASWCKPCREDNPKLLMAYNGVKNRDFEIVSISVDKDRQKWLKAIEQDRTSWVHLSNLQGWDEVSETYGVKAVPQNFLIDPEGLIVDKNIVIDQLAERLETILPK